MMYKMDCYVVEWRSMFVDYWQEMLLPSVQYRSLRLDVGEDSFGAKNTGSYPCLWQKWASDGRRYDVILPCVPCDAE